MAGTCKNRRKSPRKTTGRREGIPAGGKRKGKTPPTRGRGKRKMPPSEFEVPSEKKRKTAAHSGSKSNVAIIGASEGSPTLGSLL